MQPAIPAAIPCREITLAPGYDRRFAAPPQGWSRSRLARAALRATGTIRSGVGIRRACIHPDTRAVLGASGHRVIRHLGRGLRSGAGLGRLLAHGRALGLGLGAPTGRRSRPPEQREPRPHAWPEDAESRTYRPRVHATGRQPRGDGCSHPHHREGRHSSHRPA